MVADERRHYLTARVTRKRRRPRHASNLAVGTSRRAAEAASGSTSASTPRCSSSCILTSTPSGGSVGSNALSCRKRLCWSPGTSAPRYGPPSWTLGPLCVGLVRTKAYPCRAAWWCTRSWPSCWTDVVTQERKRFFSGVTPYRGAAGVGTTPSYCGGRPRRCQVRLGARAGSRANVAAVGRLIFPVRPDGVDALADLVVAAASDVEPTVAVDLYSGVGVFAGVLAARGWSVTAVEGSDRAVRDAEANLAGLGVRVVRADVTRWHPEQAALVVADPSRAGLGSRGVSVVTGTERSEWY